MSEQPVITLEELKTIIENVSPLDIKKIVVEYYKHNPDVYIITKDELEISFDKPLSDYYSNCKTIVCLKFKHKEIYPVWKLYNINYNELIKPLVYKFTNNTS